MMAAQKKTAASREMTTGRDHTVAVGRLLAGTTADPILPAVNGVVRATTDGALESDLESDLGRRKDMAVVVITAEGTVRVARPARRMGVAGTAVEEMATTR